MKKLNVFLLAFVFLFAVAVFAQNPNVVIPKGMEAIKVGGSAEVIVPKGALTRKVGAQLIVEGTKEYVARRFEEMSDRFDQLEANQVALRQEVEALKATVNALQKP